jgi:hypothetical protein
VILIGSTTGVVWRIAIWRSNSEIMHAFGDVKKRAKEDWMHCSRLLLSMYMLIVDESKLRRGDLPEGKIVE